MKKFDFTKFNVNIYENGFIVPVPQSAFPMP